MSRLRSLTAYVISRLVDMEASFGKTKLVKLLYLIDVENYRQRSRKISELDWVFYHYGPYAFEIDQALKQLDLDIPQEEVITRAGHRAVVLKPSCDMGAESESQFSNAEKLTMDRVLREWGLEELNPILSYVYFHTEPMKDAKRGEVLDFSRIRRATVWQVARHGAEVSPGRLKELQAEFQKVKAQRSRQAHRPLDPKPRIDDVFWHGLTYLHSEELYSVPRGDIELSEEFKGQIQQGPESKQ